MPAFFSQEMLYRIPAVIIALVFHEYAHARVADHLGDPTPRYHNRLTLNPIRHLDPLGMLMLWIARFGWAKPVPINPMYFRGNRRRGVILVSLAGPLANLVIAFLFVVLWRWQYFYFANAHLSTLFLIIIQFNLIIAVFNLLPVPPLDGSKILGSLFPSRYDHYFTRLEQYGFLILILLIFSGFLGSVLIPAVGALTAVMFSIVFYL